MEVMVQNSSNKDNFEFSGTMSSPYLSAPSSPKRFGEYYLSAPTSPSRVSDFYGEFDDYYFSTTTSNKASTSSSSSTMHFQQVDANNNNNDGEGDGDGDGFAFFVSRESEKPSRLAEELFDGGKIKLLESKGYGHKEEEEEGDEEEEGREIVSKIFSQKKKEAKESHQETQHRRGRDRTPASSSSTLTSSNSGRRITRSHSPYRTPSFQEQQQQLPLTNKLEGPSILSSNNNNKGGSSSSKRWRIKDFLLFRSASEGRASTKDQLKNILFYNNKSLNKHDESIINKTSSFRSIDSSFRKKGHVSPHELHYAMKRAESEDLKKRTYLPYKQGILGRLAGFGI